MGLILPPSVQAEMETPRQARAAKALSEALNAHDPDLSLVWVKSDIPEWELPENVIPGRWHVKQDVAPEPRYYAITTPSGGYREPDFGVLYEMQARDLHRGHGSLPRPEDPLKKDRAAKSLADEQRLDEMKADFRAAKRVAGDGGVTKRKWGRG